MTAAHWARSFPICLVLAACGGSERSASAAPGSASSPRAEPAAPGAAAEVPARPPRSGRPPLRDPVRLSATADVGGEHFQFSGLGECQHTADASIYEVPASMWSARFTDDAGKLSYLNLTLWQLRAGPAVQVSLGLTAGGETSEIATGRGADPRGSGTGRVRAPGRRRSTRGGGPGCRRPRRAADGGVQPVHRARGRRRLSVIVMTQKGKR